VFCETPSHIKAFVSSRLLSNATVEGLHPKYTQKWLSKVVSQLLASLWRNKSHAHHKIIVILICLVDEDIDLLPSGVRICVFV
jgi:hypothetical protein